MSTDDELTGFEIPSDFSMPTMAEIEEILALGDRSWTSLLGVPPKPPELMPRGRRSRWQPAPTAEPSA